MATAVVMALAGLTVAQSFTAARQANAVPPEMGASGTHIFPEPDRHNPQVIADGESYYEVTVFARAGGQGGEPQPAGGANVFFRLVPEDGAPADGAFFPDHGETDQIHIQLPPEGVFHFRVAATAPGTYRVHGIAEETHQVFIDPEFFFAPAVPASAAKSTATIQTGSRQANAQDPAVLEDPDLMERLEVTVKLRDADDNPVTDAASGGPGLKIQAAATDPLNGAGLMFLSPEGMIGCLEGLDSVTGQCESGEYWTAVSSSTPGDRELEVVYADGQPGSFKVANSRDTGSTVLLAHFYLELSLEHSTLMVSPSTPPNNPDDPADDGAGVPDAIPAGATYQVTVTLWDAGRINRVDEGSVYLTLQGADCHATFSNGVKTEAAFKANAQGRATTEVTSDQVGECTLYWDEDDPSKVKQLVWVDGSIDVASPKTWFSVSTAAVLADGQDQGGIEVQLFGANGKAATQHADAITVAVPDGSGISVESFAHTGNGRYVAAFTGTVAGQHSIAVKVDGQDLSIQAGIGNATARLVEADQPPPAAARSEATVTYRADQRANHDRPNSTVAEWGRQTIKATLEDASGNPVTRAASDLVAAAAPGDPLDGLGLYFGNGQAFACEQAPVDGECLSGVYTLDAYSSKAGERQITVTYRPGTPDALVLVNGA
ncbi:MAG: Ig-like domain-containing protein, partial [Bifidobacteriaceae bacterium]|nr:Ig-like domain-containing protein [Bifidobacteriaceae bacterium]